MYSPTTQYYSPGKHLAPGQTHKLVSKYYNRGNINHLVNFQLTELNTGIIGSTVVARLTYNCFFI